MTAKHLCDDTDLNNLHADYLVPWVSFNLRELELRVVWVHALDLFPCWSTQNLDNLNELVNSTLSRKQRLHG